MSEVTLHVYDVTNSGSDQTNSTIMQINKIFKDGIGLGGIFHSAVQVYGDEEWSFGFCEHGTGVFHCPSTKNPMYTYRESIKLGKTTFSISKVNQILRELSREWPGESYDLLAKNCNHFCDEFCERLGVPKLPGVHGPSASWLCISNDNLRHKWIEIACWSGILIAVYISLLYIWNDHGWVNRFAHAGDAAVEIAGNTAYRFKQAKTEIVTASKVAYRFLAGITSNNLGVSPDSPGNSNSGTPRFQPTWFKNLTLPGAEPSSSSQLENQDQDVISQQQRQDAEAPLRLTSEHDT